MQVSELKLEATMTSLKEIKDNGFNISSNLRCVYRPERRCLEAPSQTGAASGIYATCSSQIWGQNLDLKTCYNYLFGKKCTVGNWKHWKSCVCSNRHQWTNWAHHLTWSTGERSNAGLRIKIGSHDDLVKGNSRSWFQLEDPVRFFRNRNGMRCEALSAHFGTTSGNASQPNFVWCGLQATWNRTHRGDLDWSWKNKIKAPPVN